MSTRTHIFSLKVNPEQRKTIIQFINFNSWDLDEMLFKEGSVCRDTNCDDQDFESISQNENCDECPHCLRKPCITDEQNRQM